jgi:carboxypeptidase D
MLAESPKDKINDNLIIWLEGGPGCSSLIGGFFENGPLNITKNETGGLKTEINVNSWTNFANMLYLDPTTAAGYSIADDMDKPYSDLSSAK